MELGIYAVIAVAVIVAVAAFSKKLGVAAPIILVVVGVGLSYLPGVPDIEVPHEIILDGVLPPILYAAAIALGAVISPPDAVAATSIGRRLGLPPRLLTVLEGEGLLNDATALVLLRSAVAAAAVGGLTTP